MKEQELRNAMETWGDTVYRLALCRLQNAADAEDVYQDVFLSFFRQRAEGWEAERTKAWLIRSALNRCADLGRSRSRRGTVPLEELPDQRRSEEEGAELWDAVARLPEQLRTEIHLHYGEGCPTKEIAALLRVPAATVRSRLHRGRNQLREWLGGMDHEKPLSETDRDHPYARRAE